MQAAAQEIPRQPRPLIQKLAKIKAQLGPIRETGTHEHFGYAYLTKAEICNAVRQKMGEVGIMTTWDIVKVEQQGEIHLVDVAWCLIDGESGDSEIIRVPGVGQDKQDKGLMKAIGASHKTLLYELFEISGEEPDGQSAQARRPQRPPESRPSNSAPEPAQKDETRTVRGAAIKDVHDALNTKKEKFYWAKVNGNSVMCTDPALFADLGLADGKAADLELQIKAGIRFPVIIKITKVC